MESLSLCSRKRPCGGALLQLHQEAQSPCPASKRKCGEGGVLKRVRRSGGSGRENREPDLRKNSRTQNLRKARFPHTGTRNKVKTQSDPTARSGLRFGGEVQSSRPEVRVALIRKTRFQTSVQTVELRRSEDQQTRIRSRSIADQQETQGLVSETRTSSRRRSERVLDPETLMGKRAATRTRIRTSSRSVRGRTETRRRRKIQLSMITGRGQLRLSITPEAGQLIIHIHEAQGLMGKDQRSCDSYVKVTSDLGRMKTPTVLNNKNPQYNHSFTLCVSDKLLPHRLLVSVLRRQTDSRCSQLIGCMSFRIGSVVSSSKLVNGWFHLLGEEFGLSKHLRVTSQRQEREESEERATHYADLRRTPDSAPDTDLNPPTAVTAMPPRTTSTARLKDRTLHSRTSSRPLNLGPTGTSSVPALFSSCSQRPTVSITRGKDGFGFTICSDCPVRVQAVDPGGPAHQSGLRQGDSVLQLNGLPVETWKCVDLAHTIRSCPSQIVLVVWRGLPELRPGCESLLHPPTSTTYNMTSGRKLLPHPAHSKHGHRQGQGSRVQSTLGALGSLWRDRKEEEEVEEEEEEAQEVTEFSPPATTLRGTRVRSSNGDNYIILSPVSAGGQLLQPVYHDGTGTLGRLYQTHRSRGQSLLHHPQSGSSRQPFTSHTSTLPPSSLSLSSSAGEPSNYGNYQNCTIVQSHLPCSAFGSYMTLAPKTLIFPVFVQPLDLCSPDRTLLMSEEMVLHQADSLPAKVTVLIYSDLLLLTREDEAGRCNVLQSPLYLNTLQLREVPSEPLLLYLLQTCSHCVLSLESFSIEQKVRVRLCLHDNIHHQQVPTETALPSDFNLLSVGQSDPLCRSSSPYPSPDPHLLNPSSLYSSLRPPSPFSSSAPSLPSSSPLSPYTSSSTSPPTRTITALPHPCHPLLPSSIPIQRSPIWKERGRVEEEEEEERRRKREEDDEDVEERQQGEGESASETSESAGGVWGRGILLSPSHLNMKKEESDDDVDEKEEQGGAEEFRPAVLRRSLSEGYLLQEPRSPRFLSDSTIHQLTRPVTFDPDSDSDPDPPSPNTLRKQLTRKGGSLHQMLLLLNGPKESEFRNVQLKKKNRTLATDVRSRLAFLRRRKNSTCFHGNSLEKALRNNRPSLGEVLRWAESLEALLTNQYGLAVFRHFLRSEFSEENLDFWLAVERFKRTRPVSKMTTRAAKIYDEFISTSAARQVNVDSAVRESTNQSLCLGVSPSSFQLAQEQIFSLMESDSYPRFLRSRLYIQLANRDLQNTTVSASHSGAGFVSVSQS